MHDDNFLSLNRKILVSGRLFTADHQSGKDYAFASCLYCRKYKARLILYIFRYLFKSLLCMTIILVFRAAEIKNRSPFKIVDHDEIIIATVSTHSGFSALA